MKVRIVKHSHYSKWTVETKHWWQFSWRYFMEFCGNDAFDAAKNTAKALINPEIIYGECL